MLKVICKNCGCVYDVEHYEVVKSKKCKFCGAKVDWDNLFPSANAREFIQLSHLLHEDIKNYDKKRREIEHKYITKQGIDIDLTEVDRYNNMYDSIVKNYSDNDDKYWIEILDKFEEKVCKELNDAEKAASICAAVDTTYHSHKNSLRKSFVITVASTLELMFNDYIGILIKFSLPENGQKVFMRKNRYAGIQSLLDEINYFLEKPFNEMADVYSGGFSNKWKTCRDTRNAIVHSNNKYITNTELSDYIKLLSEAINVFSGLISDLYKKGEK